MTIRNPARGPAHVWLFLMTRAARVAESMASGTGTRCIGLVTGLGIEQRIE
jgi:hypothetical protein